MAADIVKWSARFLPCITCHIILRENHAGSEYPSVKTTDAELFLIRLAITKAIATGCSNIVVFTDNLPAARKAIDTTVHSRQNHSLAVSRLLRSHFTTHPEGSIHFWDCLSDTKWFIQAKVHDEARRARYPAEENWGKRAHILRRPEEQWKTWLDEWRAEFWKGENRSHSTKTNERDEASPSYTKVRT